MQQERKEITKQPLSFIVKLLRLFRTISKHSLIEDLPLTKLVTLKELLMIIHWQFRLIQTMHLLTITKELVLTGKETMTMQLKASVRR